jgi:PucR family transcriptional regulator, purine catabolism regulatory protein
MAFTLGSLLDQEELGLRLLTGEPSCRERLIAGAHAIEIENPVRWLEPQWVMLTTGVRLRHNGAAQRSLVSELAEGGITALGFAVEMVFKSVPRPIVEEAERRGFPVFVIPYETPHRAIISFVSRSLLSSDFYLLHRSLSMQSYLMDALAAEHPEDELVRRLGSLLGSTVLVYSADGQLEASRGEAPAAAIWAAVAEREPALQEFAVGRWFVVSVPIVVRGVIRQWLALATRRASVSEQLARPVIRAAERLLELVAVTRETAAAEERAVRSELLRRALAGQTAAGDGELADRITAFGFEPGQSCAIAVIAPVGSDGADAVAARPRLEALLAGSRLPYLLADSDAQLVLLHGGRAPLDQWLRRLTREGFRLVAAVGRPISTLGEASESLRDAQLALGTLGRDAQPGRVLRFEEFDLATWLLSDLGAERLQVKVDELLAPVRESDMLYDTLLAYLDEDLDLGRTARALHLHPNSLRYRLRQLERRLGHPLRSAATIANLHLATLAERAARRGDGGTASGSSLRSAPPPRGTAAPRGG